MALKSVDSDIKLLFGVATSASDGGDSEALIRQQLQSIVSNINNKPIGIKVKLDTKAENALRRQIADIFKSVSIDGININQGSSKVSSQVQTGMSLKEIGAYKSYAETLSDELKKVYNDVTSLMGQLNGRFASGANDRNYALQKAFMSFSSAFTARADWTKAITGANGTALVGLVGSLESAYSALEKMQAAAKGTSFEGMFNIPESSIENLRNLRAEIDKVSASSAEIAIPQEKAAGVQQASQPVQESVKQTVAAEANLNTQTVATLENNESLTQSFEKLATVINSVIEKLNELTNAEEKNNSESKDQHRKYEQYKEARDALNEYTRLRKSAIANSDIEFNDGVYTSKNGEATELAAQLNAAKQKTEQLTSAENQARMGRKLSKQLTDDITSAENEYSLALEKTNQKLNGTEKTEKNRVRQLKSAQALLEKFTGAKSNWTAMRNGRLSGDYNNIVDAIPNLQGIIDELTTGNVSAERLTEIEGILNNYGTSFKDISVRAKEAGENTKSFGDRIGGVAKKFGEWFGATRIILAAVRYMKQMVSASIELESALTKLKIVTGASDSEMRKFSQTAITTAKSLGKDLTETISAIETFSRLGYNLEESNTLATFASIMSNVAATDLDSATTGITSIIKGFNMKVDDAEHVADVLIKVGQNYAVSASEMMEAYEKSGAALNATNTSFEKSAGLIAAANASVQNASVAGTALKTVAARIRGSKSDLEELGEDTEDLANGFSKYAKEIKAITGFDIMVEGSKDTFKDLYDIFDGIAKVWDTLSDTQRARLSEILGGTRQLQVISSIIGNWGDAAGAYEDAMNAAGTATNANAIYLDTAEAKLNQLKTTFKEFGSNIFESDAIKDVLDFGSGILNILNGLSKAAGKLGGLSSIIKSILAGAAIKNLYKLPQLFDSIKKSKLISSVLNNISSLKTTFITAFNAASKGITGVRAGLKAMIAEAGAAQVAFGALALVVSGLIIAVNAYQQRKSEAITKEADLLDSSIAKTRSELEQFDDFQKAYTEYQKYANITNRTTEQELAYKKAVDAVNESLEDKLKLINAFEGGSEGYSTALDEAIREEFKEAAENNRELSRKTGSKIINKASQLYQDESYFEHPFKNMTLSSYYGYSTDGYELWNLTPEEQELMNKYMGAYWRKERVLGGLYYSLGENPRDLSPEDILKYFDALQEEEKFLYNNGYSGSRMYEWIEKQIAYYEEIINEYKDTFSIDTFIYDAFGESGIPKTEEDLEALREKILKAAKDSGEFNGQLDLLPTLLDYSLKKIPALASLYEELAEKTRAASNEQVSFREAMSKVELTSKGLDMLGKIYNDVKDGADFDWSSILNNEDFANTFQDYGDAYTNFVKIVASSPKDISACQDAFDELVSAYLNGKDVLKDLSDETRDATVAFLEQKGVTNAAKIVDAELAIRKEKLAQQTKISADATFSEVAAMIQESGQSEVVQIALARLALEKLRLNNTKINTADDINQLITLAEFAGASTASLLRLAKAKALVSKMDSLGGASGDDARKEKLAIRSLNNVDAIVSEIESLLNDPYHYVPPTYSGPASGGGGSGSSSSTEDTAKTITDNAKKAFDDMIKYRVNMLKKELDTLKDFLNKKLSTLKEIYDEQKDLLKKQLDEDKYLEEQAEKRKEVSDLKAQLDQLSRDDSAWAQKRRVELSQSLADAQKALYDFERDKAVDVATEAIDKTYETQEKAIKADIEKIDASLNDPNALFNQALIDIRNNSKGLYELMILYNRKNGTGSDEDIASMWDEWTEALAAYKKQFGESYYGITLGTKQSISPDSDDIFNHLAIATEFEQERAVWEEATLVLSDIKILLERIIGHSFKDIEIGEGYASGTSNATPGLHKVFEGGSEYIFKSSNGSSYKLFSGGEKVLNAGATDFLYKLANGRESILQKMVNRAMSAVGSFGMSSGLQNNSFTLGDIIVNGNANEATVSEIRRAQREQVNNILKSFQKLKA